jgi:UDP-N-acetylglucosamine transferase subunit ALG13
VILVSVGTQLPFDRLIKAVDDWTHLRGRKNVVAQIGPSDYLPKALDYFSFMEHDRFFELQSQCSVMVSHAGMGSIITALELGKPIIILARDHKRNEHRNAHQSDTLRQFAGFKGIYAARDEAHVAELLDQCDTMSALPSIDSAAPRAFIDRLEHYVQNETVPSRRSRLWAMLRRR